jgi:hypothetical protein
MGKVLFLDGFIYFPYEVLKFPQVSLDISYKMSLDFFSSYPSKKKESGGSVTR